jgi:hypothetical protein
MLAAVLLFINVSPAAALDLNPADYFQLTFEPTSFDKVEIAPGGVFNAIIKGRADCSKSLPISVSQAVITSRVVARHNASGASLTLNESYTVTIKPFPGKKGETFEINQTIPLQFPPQAEPGDYTVIGQLIEAKVKVFFIWQSVTGSFPREQGMGTVKVILPEPAPPAPQPAASETPPSSPPPAPTPAPSLTPTPEPTGPLLPWWGELLITTVAAGGIVSVALFLRHRRR